MVARIATGEVEETPPKRAPHKPSSSGKSKAKDKLSP